MNTPVKNKLKLAPFLGKWINSYDKARAIGHFTFSEVDGHLMMAVEGSPQGILPGDWGTVKANAHAYTPYIDDVVAFQASFKNDDFESFLAINENKGLLVIAAYFTFPEDDPRSDSFVREFFYKN